MFIGGTDVRWFFAGAVAAAGGIGAVIFNPSLLGILAHYAGERVAIWLDPFSDPLNAGFQTVQSLYAIGSGGLLGTGMAHRGKSIFIFLSRITIFFCHSCRGTGLYRGCYHHIFICFDDMARNYHSGKLPGTIRRSGRSRFDFSGWSSSSFEHRGCDQYCPQHRHIPAILFVRRNELIDAAVRDGGYPFHIPRFHNARWRKTDMMKILFACGGTAGHINPALAVADELCTQYPGTAILFAGNPLVMEARLVAKAGYPFAPIELPVFSASHHLKICLKTPEHWCCWRKAAGVRQKLFEIFLPML